MNQQLAISTPHLPAPQAAPPKTGMLSADLVERYWQELLRRKWLVAAIMLACLLLGLLATMAMTPVYTATARIEISRAQENVTNVQGVQAEEAGQSLEFYQTHYSLLETRSLAARVGRSLNLVQDGAFLSAYEIEPAEDVTDLQDKVVDILLGDIAIDPIRGSSLVDIRFTSPDRALSAKIANAWAEQYIAATLDRRFAATADARDFLEGQLGDLRERLEKSESELVNYAADKRIIALSTSEASDGNTRTERTLAASDLEALSRELVDATAARIAAESALRAGGGATADLLGNSAINGLRQERGMVAAEYARLLGQFEPGYPAARALKSQLDALDSAIAREEARASSTLRRAFREAAAREGDLRARVELLKGELIGQRRDSIQYAIYQREVDTNRELYDALLQRFKEIGVAGVGSNTIAVVDQAQVPDSPSSPSLFLNLLAALVVGCGLSGALVFASELADQSVRDLGDVRRALGLPLLGSIPLAEEGPFEELIRDQKTETVEAYLSVKTSLSFLTDHGVPRSLMLTSTGPNEGKSVSALALAEILARSGSRVVLVDADMRNPSIRKLLSLEAQPGLSNYLAGQGDAAQFILPEISPNLDILGAGPQPPNAAELLGTARMHHLVQSLMQTYDHVLVDSPPVMGLADAPLLSAVVEGVVVTIEANRFKLRAIQNSVDRLHAANAHILGALVTKVDRRNASYGYGYGNGYGYKYVTEGAAVA